MAATSPDSGTTLTVRKTIPLPRQRVFAAWLDPESMKIWMCPGNIESTEAQVEARVGGKFRIVMKGKDHDYEHTGEYRVIDPPSKLAFTWISEGTDHAATLVTIDFLDRGQSCEVVLTHERFPQPDKVEGHRKGWGEILDLLADYVVSGGKQNARK